MNGFLAQLTSPAVIGLLLTGSLLVVTTDWRIGFGALAVQYLLAALLIAQIVVWQVVVVKLLVGFLVVTIIVLTGRQVNYGYQLDSESGLPQIRFEISTGLPFRAVAVATVLVAAWYIAGQSDFTLAGVPLGLSVGSYLLLGLGLLNLGLTEEPMNAGLGLLTLLTGFELIYAAVEPSLAVVALLAGVDFAVALAVSYLAFVRYAAPESEGLRR